MEHKRLCILIVILSCITVIKAEGCSIDPCQNGGTCELAILEPGYVCLCSLQWIGKHCDFNVDNMPRRGPSPVTCSWTYTGTTGLLTSPNWPNRAGINELCIYSIRIPTATTIFIHLNYFMSEINKDDLFYTTGPHFDISDPSNFGFSGNETRLGTYSYDTNQMTFGWTSDRNIESKGFNITYSTDSNPCINEPCRNGATCQPSGISYTCQICPVQDGEEFCERGVEVTGTSISITSGNPIVERRNQHQVTFDLNIGTNPEGSSVIGNNLWAVSYYYSTSDIPGNGVSSPRSSVVLTPFQSGTGIVSPGVPTTLEGLSGTLNLTSVVCRNVQYVCAILSRNPSSDPPFFLSPSPGSDESVMRSCAPVQCREIKLETETETAGKVNVLIAALGVLAGFTALIILILIISCAFKARNPSSARDERNPSSARDEQDVSNDLFSASFRSAMSVVMSNLRRQRPAPRLNNPDPEAVADEPNVGVYMDPENRGQENMGPLNRPLPPVPRRSFHLYASRVAGLFRTTSNREEQH